MTRTALATVLALTCATTVWAAPTPSSTPGDAREEAAANALSDLVNQDRQLAPRYTNPEDLTGKTLLELLREAEQADVPDEQWMQDPFVHIEKDMASVVDDLSATRSDKPVQDKQAEIVRKLDVLIAQLEQACQNCQSACSGSGEGTNNPSSPMQDSMLSGGPGGQGELRDPGQSTKRWTDLPPKDREKILQSKTEGFPAGYEDVLEEYYRRLAETATPADTTAPAPEDSAGDEE